MDVTLIENFRKFVNGSIDEIITSVIEQYDTEIKRLEEVITTSTELLKEKELLVLDLKKQLKDNEFDEENFNKVSLLKTLSRQIDDLQKENKTLNDSLRLRREHSNSMSEDLNTENMVLSTEEVGNDEVHTSENVEDVNNDEQNNEDTNLDMVESVIIGEEENVEVAINEATNENLELTEDDEDEVEVVMEEIVHKEKTYYVKDSKMYNKKKNGDIGKEVGTYIDGKAKLKKKNKDKNKDKNKKNNTTNE